MRLRSKLAAFFVSLSLTVSGVAPANQLCHSILAPSAPAATRALQLDELYGVAIAPLYSKPWELDEQNNFIPNPNVQRFTPGTRRIRETELDRTLVYDWVIPEDGEGILLAPQVFVAPNRALGHPSLTRGAPARIAGELRWDSESRRWYITDESGRYNFLMRGNFMETQRGPTQFSNAQRLFTRLGLDVELRALPGSPSYQSN